MCSSSRVVRSPEEFLAVFLSFNLISEAEVEPHSRTVLKVNIGKAAERVKKR